MGIDSIFCHRLHQKDRSESSLNQKLNLLNLSFSGVAVVCTVFLTQCGDLVGKYTGASAFLSCILASLIAIFPGMCIVEFATKMPSAGSLYTFTYATVGESIAFLVGWNNLFDNMMLSAAAGKASSALIDRWTGGAISNLTASPSSLLSDNSENKTMPFQLFETSPDFVAALILLGLSIVLIFAVNISVTFFNVLAAAFLACFLVVVFSCFAYGNTANLTSTGGTIFSHGLTGVVNGASLIIFTFMFYDIIAISAEESVDPHINVPRSALIVHMILTIFLILSCVSIAFLVPNSLIDLKSAFLGGFQHLGIKWLVSFTFTISLIALTATGLAFMFSSSRYLYAISRDSLLPSPISYLQPKFRSPVAALGIVTIIIIIMALFFDEHALIMISVSRFVFSVLVVGIDLMILRYMPFCAPDADIRNTLEFRPILSRLLDNADNRSWMKKPVFFVVLLMTEILSIFFSAIVLSASFHMYNRYVLWAAGFIFICLSLAIFVVLCFYQPNPVPTDEKGFTVPVLPLVPIASIILGILSAIQLPFISWTRFIILSAVGLVFYFVHRLFQMSRKKEDYETISDSEENKPVLLRDTSRMTM